MEVVGGRDVERGGGLVVDRPQGREHRPSARFLERAAQTRDPRAVPELTDAGVARGEHHQIRADQIEVQTGGTTTRLRYVNCPFAPFLDDPAQNVCEGL